MTAWTIRSSRQFSSRIALSCPRTNRYLVRVTGDPDVVLRSIKQRLGH